VNDLSDHLLKMNALHKLFIKQISYLFDYSLVSSSDKWTENLNSLIEQFDELGRTGFTNTKSWKKHLNAQIFKALDY
jgi:hypothetical protein